MTNVKLALSDARQVKTVWQDSLKFKVGEIGFQQYTEILEAAEELNKDYAAKSLELAGLKASRDAKLDQLTDLVKRFRYSVRGAYGADSPQYEQAATTRKMSRKVSKSNNSGYLMPSPRNFPP